MAKCSSCGAEIIWIETPEGKKIPTDKRRIRVYQPDGSSTLGHPSHFGSCPQAAKWSGSSRKDQSDNAKL